MCMTGIHDMEKVSVGDVYIRHEKKFNKISTKC